MSPVPSPARASRNRELLSDGVHRRLLRAILDGTLVPGERLHDDELIGWLGVSRTPIRTALERMAELGVVEMEPNRYTRVARPTPRCLLDALSIYAALHVVAIRSTVPTLSDADLDELAGRVAALRRQVAASAEPLRAGADGADAHRAPDAHWGLDDLRAVDSVIGFFATKTQNPIMGSVLREVEMRLVFFFGSLPVPVVEACFDDFCDDLLRAARARDPAAVAEVVSSLIAGVEPIGAVEPIRAVEPPRSSCDVGG